MPKNTSPANLVLRLEEKLEGISAILPRLPQNLREWITTNVWWISLVLAIITTISTLIYVRVVFRLASFSSYAQVYPYSTSTIGTLIGAGIVQLVIAALCTGLLYAAVAPLKRQSRRGWQLLFLYVILSVMSVIINFVIIIKDFAIGDLFINLLLGVVELYFLFQVRRNFSSREARAAEAEIVDNKTADKK